MTFLAPVGARYPDVGTKASEPHEAFVANMAAVEPGPTAEAVIMLKACHCDYLVHVVSSYMISRLVSVDNSGHLTRF